MYDKPSKSGFYEQHWITKTESAPLLITPQSSNVHDRFPQSSNVHERFPHNPNVPETVAEHRREVLTTLHNQEGSRLENPQSSNSVPKTSSHVFPQSSNSVPKTSSHDFPQSSNTMPYHDTVFQSSDLKSDNVMMSFRDQKDSHLEPQSSNVYKNIPQSSLSNVIPSHDNQDKVFHSRSVIDSQSSNVTSAHQYSQSSNFVTSSHDGKNAESSCPDLERLDRSYTSVYENSSTSYGRVYDKNAR